MPVTGFMPHMHTRGAGFRYEVAYPAPTKLVRWGSQTVDEMMIGYVEYFRPLKP
jgi:hypothetical protein